jgi:hypothetical protein
MQDEERDDEVSIGHSSTTAPGGEKDLPRSSGGSGDPGSTPGTAEGDEETVDQDIEQKLG